MRERADEERIRACLRELGRRARAPGRIYLTGGATAVLVGWRSSAVAYRYPAIEPAAFAAEVQRAFG